jgi:hypothetical protein
LTPAAAAGNTSPPFRKNQLPPALLAPKGERPAPKPEEESMSQQAAQPAESGKPKLQLEDEFTFACHRGLECYTSCCRDVNIFLTPNDVIRLKKALGLTSTEFLQQYADIVVVKDRHLPLVQLRMNEEDGRKCFFVRPHGCLYYADRPWACRMFPLDERPEGGYTVVAEPAKCHGLDQGATQSKEADGSYDGLAAHHLLRGVDVNNDQILNMIVTALWDVDGFRKLVLNSSFLDKFELEPERVDAIKTDDYAMLDLGYDWVRFGMLGQKSLKLKGEAE